MEKINHEPEKKYLEDFYQSEDEVLFYMQEAINQCELSLQRGEVPVGCIFLHYPSKQIIARGHNLTNKTKNATTHAEINCIYSISEILSCEEKKKQFVEEFKLEGYEINSVEDIFRDCILYVSCEPCIMCAHALNLISKKK
jgi:tRNA-specific adenosine deaminase 2